ncbi:hypothetical protein C5C18_06690 [Rathayibacter tritici]|uniref:hypothetical protein n=1 Tax=Rathayibacter tritici TaxID=33888 RepID=UPI0008331979|nr:hypothetical protein [Rathayibacter tritici]PPF31252.1 hypothetical protein C5C06_02055 [Rathayibacter tritici]PPF69076.1 hypothetical protein C5C21_04275 [Rathayibacter tritici]PPG07792.1 hypothetical protein C5C18_06690 [Rathayibacter tritici]PPI12677.1 hypothetical protein C5D07_12555 [Rathayibacter tritici]PPI42818.1 hypothetical protein C5D18_12735 [Rathayibacter tritici]
MSEFNAPSRSESTPTSSDEVADDGATYDAVPSRELLRIEQAPLPERASGYTRLQEQLRLRLENADRDR